MAEFHAESPLDIGEKTVCSIQYFLDFLW
jgi:hypothetical protein